ncbi:MAG: hypothetical protein WC377_08980 [Bacteroidales bacterium]|nr:hypothetical protein [Bacteroidales bacterium]
MERNAVERETRHRHPLSSLGRRSRIREGVSVLPVSKGIWKCGAEQTGGRAGNAVAGAFTGGMRCGTVPIVLGLVIAALRSSVERFRSTLAAGGAWGGRV